jgi:quinohemoprotein ethanol dehydrogenase
MSHGWAYGVHTRRLIAFSLEGTAELPVLPPPTEPTPLTAPEFGVDATIAAQGAAEYGGTCLSCHGLGAVSGGMAPDLRASGVVLSASGFAGVVQGGERAAKGMPKFEDLTDEQLLAIRHYIRQQAEAALAAKKPD